MLINVWEPSYIWIDLFSLLKIGNIDLHYKKNDPAFYLTGAFCMIWIVNISQQEQTTPKLRRKGANFELFAANRS